MNRQRKTLLISGTITLVISLVIMVLSIKDWVGVSPIAAVFLIWAEIALFGGLIFMEKIRSQTEQVILQASYLTLLPIYSVITAVLSIIFIIQFNDEWKIFIIVQLIILGVTAILLIVFYTASKGVYDSNVNTMHAIEQTSAYVSRLNLLAVSAGEEEYGLLLKELAEDLRFSDTCTIVSTDTTIDGIISEIELEFSKETILRSEKLIQKECRMLSTLIKKRKIMVSSVKKGKI